MRPLTCAVLAGVLLGGAIGVEDAEAGERKRWKHGRAYDHDSYCDEHHHRDYRDRDYRDRDYRDHEYRYRDHRHRDGYFSRHEVHLVREYYRPRYRRLPPGLRRQYYRRGYLPPGWERRVEPYPVYVEREVVVLPRGYRRGIIDGHAVVYNSRGLIVDVAVLF